MKSKQFNTNIIFRTTKELKQLFKDYCIDNKTTISKELNNFINKSLKENKKKEINKYNRSI